MIYSVSDYVKRLGEGYCPISVYIAVCLSVCLSLCLSGLHVFTYEGLQSCNFVRDCADKSGWLLPMYSCLSLHIMVFNGVYFIRKCIWELVVLLLGKHVVGSPSC